MIGVCITETELRRNRTTLDPAAFITAGFIAIGRVQVHHSVFAVIYFVAMAAVIVLLDVLLLRDHFWWRLGTNISVVAGFALVYVLVLRHHFT